MTNSDYERAEEEAAEWLVMLTEEPDNPEVRANFDAWCAQNPVNAAIWERTSRAYDLLGYGQPAHREAWAADVPVGAEEHRLPPAPVRRRCPAGRRGPKKATRRVRTVRAVAAGAVAAALLAAYLPAFVLNLRSDYVTGAAEPRTVALADGSTVRLGPKTAIAVGLEGQERLVRILEGEAWFDVAHDPSRPFRVESRDARVTVLGTAFDVRQDDADTTVAVQRGHVRVEPTKVDEARNHDLFAGDAIALGGSTAPLRRQVAAAEVGDRTRGTLVVRDRPVTEIVEALRPWHRGMIVVRGSGFEQWRVSGLYDLTDPVGTLTTLVGQRGGTVRQITPWLLVASAD